MVVGDFVYRACYRKEISQLLLIYFEFLLMVGQI